MVLTIEGAICKLWTNYLVTFDYNWCQFGVTGNCTCNLSFVHVICLVCFVASIKLSFV